MSLFSLSIVTVGGSSCLLFPTIQAVTILWNGKALPTVTNNKSNDYVVSKVIE